MKTCSKCGVQKPLEMFAKEKLGKGGLRSNCRVCGRAKSAKWAAENAERVKANKVAWLAANPGYHAAWAAANPGKVKEKTAKWNGSNPEKRKAIVKDWRRRNPDAVKAAQARWAAAHPETVRANNAAWKQNNPERARELHANWRAANPEKISAWTAKWQAANPEAKRAIDRGCRARRVNAPGKHTASDVAALLKLQRKKCAACQCGIGDGFHVDHIVPLAKGGSNDKINLQLLCAACNLRKAAKHPEQFMREQGFLL